MEALAWMAWAEGWELLLVALKALDEQQVNKTG